MTRTARTFTVTVSAAGSAPAWFQSASEGRWIEIAAGSARTDLSSAQRGEYIGTTGVMTSNWGLSPSAALDTDGIRCFAFCFGGGVVNQADGEFIIAQRGGHTQYAGNDAYALNVRSELPRWYRLNDPTPTASIVADSYATGAYADGRMAACHGWTRIAYANDRVWHFTLDSIYSAAGDTSMTTWAFHRKAAGIPIAPGGTALAYQANAGPFTSYGSITTGGFGADKGPSVVIGNTLWTFAGNGSPRSWAYNTSTRPASNTVSPVNEPTGGATLAPYIGWAVHLSDLAGSYVLLSRTYQSPGTSAMLFDAASPASAWVTKTLSDNFNNYQGGSGMNAVYQSGARKVYAYSYGTPGTIRALDIPASAGGTWPTAWRDVTPSGLVPTGDARASSNQYTNFSLIQNMGTDSQGNVRQALILFTNVQGPTYVMKLPVAGL